MDEVTTNETVSSGHECQALVPTGEPPHVPVLMSKHHDITPFCSDDETRHVLNGVHYNPKERYIEATDGRTLVRVPVHPMPVDTMEIKGNVADECIIPTDAFKKALKNIDDKGAMAELHYVKLMANGDSKAKLYTSDGRMEQAVVVPLVEGQFPNTDCVWPKGDVKFAICLSPDYLKRIAEYALRHGWEKQKSIKLEFYGELEPCKFSFKLQDPLGISTEACGLLMPMRMT